MTKRAPFRALVAAGICAALVAVAAAPADAIVGGSPAPPDRWPWMAGLLISDVDDVPWAQ
ncbi:MAG TPA: hypothetical protein VD836_05675 [Solirubrobacteraceae bacterium]|nr:hypothetical protein [Solirubrobacteraceae bacterium]